MAKNNKVFTPPSAENDWNLGEAEESGGMPAVEIQSANAGGGVTEAAQSAPPPIATEATTKEEGLPEDLKSCLKLRDEIRAWPEDTEKQKARKSKAFQAVAEQIFRINNGDPAPEIGANELAQSAGKRSEVTFLQRCELRAREDRLFAELLERYQAKTEPQEKQE